MRVLLDPRGDPRDTVQSQFLGLLAGFGAYRHTTGPTERWPRRSCVLRTPKLELTPAPPATTWQRRIPDPSPSQSLEVLLLPSADDLGVLFSSLTLCPLGLSEKAKAADSPAAMTTTELPERPCPNAVPSRSPPTPYFRFGLVLTLTPEHRRPSFSTPSHPVSGLR